MYKKNIRKIIFNKKVRYNYFIDKEIEAGIILKGWEIKSIRLLRVNIDNSYVFVKNREVYLIGTKISPLNSGLVNLKFDPKRIRKLLLNSFEINLLLKKKKKNGYSLVVTSLYFKGPWCKVKVAIVKGKKKYDKRIELKNKEWKKKRNRILKRHLLI